MTFDATQLTGKTLYSATATDVYHLPTVNSNKLRTVAPGTPIGVIYSYVERDGFLWWMLEADGYVLHEKGKFSTESLLEQGAIDESTLHTPHPILSMLKKTALLVIPATAIILAAYWIAKTYKIIKP